MFSLDYDLELFGLGRDATLEDLEASFRRIAREFHPDKHHGSREAERLFAVVVETYDRLKKALIDNDRIRKVRTWREQFAASAAQAHRAATHNAAPAAPQPAPHESPAKTLTVSFEDAINGSTRKTRISEHGLLGPWKTISVRVPPLTQHGTVLRLRQAGFPPIPGALPADVFVKIAVAHDYHYSVEGKDIHVKVEATDRLLHGGGPLRIPTPRGPYWAAIPPNTALRSTFRFRGLGLADAEGAGDLFVCLIPRPGLWARLCRYAAKRRRPRKSKPEPYRGNPFWNVVGAVQ